MQRAHKATNKLAGECGNRTHQARLSRVTPVLKTGEATRPHPPPCSVDFDRRFFLLNYFPDFDRTFDLRKILRYMPVRHAHQKSARRLRVA